MVPPALDVDEVIPGGDAKHVKSKPILHHVLNPEGVTALKGHAHQRLRGAAAKRALAVVGLAALGEAVRRPNSNLANETGKDLAFWGRERGTASFPNVILHVG